MLDLSRTRFDRKMESNKSESAIIIKSFGAQPYEATH